LVIEAVNAGFRWIDTACQPKHYREDLVGEALEKLFQSGMSREDLFVQTKFTPMSGQDPENVPYDPKAPLGEQVKQSITKSLSNLRTDYIDSLILHSALSSHDQTMVVWRVFEEFYHQHKVRSLGVSNHYNIKRLKKLWNDAEVKPSFVQNRFYSDTHYDPEIRTFCLEKHIWYQSFWTLTANPKIINHSYVTKLAKQKGKTPEQIFFRFVMKLGITPLTGTTSREHMDQDLEVGRLEFDLSSAEVKKLQGLLETE